MPTATIRPEIRNATRQPQAMNCSSVHSQDSRATTPEAMNRPMARPTWGREA
ncbi:MAG: hypothetical protein GAK34_01603 [Delftia tsuruhatensis]|nr:MAG: hypothetical protein GAK34_01603 [Delftia tsuruhatensis]